MRPVDGDVHALFGAAVERLAAGHRDAPALLLALALSRGRGLPRVDGTWVAVAEALVRRPVGEEAVDLLLRAAAPYIMLDGEHGRSVYRLGHRAFVEHFRDRAGPAQHRRIVRALGAAAAQRLPRAPCAYLVHHLSGHAAAGHAWDELARLPRLIDHLEPGGLAADVLRASFGRVDLPVEVAAVLAARHDLAGAAPEDRASVRAVAMARMARQPDFVATNPDAPTTPFAPEAGVVSSERTATDNGLTTHEAWLEGRRPIIVVHRSRGRRATPKRTERAEASVRGGAVRWARLQPFPLHVTLSGHDGPVRALATVPVGDGRVLLASGGDDGTVRLWNPATGQPVGDPLRGHDGPVLALAPIRRSDGDLLLASGGEDQTVRFWYPTTGQSAGEEFTERAGAVRLLAAVPLPDGREVLAVGGNNRAVRLWDPEAGESPGRLDAGAHALYAVRHLAVVPGPDRRITIATGHETVFTGDPRVQLWNPVEPGGPAATLPNRSLSGKAALVAPMPTAGGRTLLAVVEEGIGDERTLRLHDLAKNREWHTGIAGPGIGERRHRVARWSVLPLRGHTLLAASVDRVVKLWSVRRGLLRLRVEPYGDALTGHLGAVRDVVAVPMSDGRALVATAADDGTIRLWSPARDRGYAAPPKGAWFRTSTGVDPALAVTSVAAGTSPDGRAWLATASRDEWVRLWDPEHGTPAQPPMDPQADRTTWFTGTATVAAVPMPDGSALLATGSGHIVRLVDPATGASGAATELGPVRWHPWRGSDKPVNALMLGEERIAAFAPVVAMAALALPDGDAMLAVAGGRTVRLFAPTGRLGLRRLEPQARTDEDIRLVALLPRPAGAPLLAIATDATLQFSDAGSGALLSVHHVAVRALAAVPMADGSTLLATGDEDGVVRLWTPDTGLPSGEPVGRHRGAVRALAVRHGLLLSGGEDRTLRWWDPGHGGAVRALPLGVAVSGLATSGPMVVVATGEGLLRIDPDETAGA
ncbi:hypothetical protein OHA72_51690 [Dactylosporangium sp. NBC_01737]|uniref:WD40 repeat domain-containing protein n=1 Tax=Dactylosporangium sp. NBC_01737 TaxID=2975959 RepID=UPI002E14D877|nr:hypothetical protein OHA72_51690 [Dactylosporangium sp. NBC_01737]